MAAGKNQNNDLDSLPNRVYHTVVRKPSIARRLQQIGRGGRDEEEAWALSVRIVTLSACVAVSGAGQPPKSQSKGEPCPGGIVVGRGSKPLANARLFLGQVAGDQELVHAKVKIGGFPTNAGECPGAISV
jgi:hypothetical protein